MLLYMLPGLVAVCILSNFLMVCYSTNIQLDQVIDEFYFTFGRLPCMHNVVHIYVIIEGFPVC